VVFTPLYSPGVHAKVFSQYAPIPPCPQIKERIWGRGSIDAENATFFNRRGLLLPQIPCFSEFGGGQEGAPRAY
jgi:hypothetical protein